MTFGPGPAPAAGNSSDNITQAFNWRDPVEVHPAADHSRPESLDVQQG